jgi:hypothetical protein
MGWSEWGPSSRLRGFDVGQLVTDSRFSTPDPFSYQVRSTGPDGLPFFGEKPRIMLQSRLKHGSRCPWCLHARVLAASWPIRLHPSLCWCPGAVVNPPAGQPSNPWVLMGHRGIFSPYPFLPVGGGVAPSLLGVFPEGSSPSVA